MFSGIIEEAAQVVKLENEQDNLHITMKCSFTNDLKIDQSISHNGVCLTVVKKDKDTYTVTAIKETLEKTNLGLLKPEIKSIWNAVQNSMDVSMDIWSRDMLIRPQYALVLPRPAEAGTTHLSMNPHRMTISP